LPQAVPAGMTVHRVRAGALDASGWSTATSTRGNFVVRLPCLFNDFSLQGSETVVATDTVGCRREDQQKYSATRVKYQQGAAAARKRFDDMSGPRRLEGETARRRLMFNGFPAIEVDFRSSTQCGTTRSVLVGADLLLLTAEGPPTACSVLNLPAATFFASLQIALPALQSQEQNTPVESAGALE